MHTSPGGPVMKRLVSRILLPLALIAVMIPGIFADDLSTAKEAFDQGHYAPAKDAFLRVFESASGEPRLEAFLHILKCDNFLKDHDSLESFYNTHKALAAGTIFEPAAAFVYANSLFKNVANYEEALTLYRKISRDFPESPFAAPGSLLNAGIIQVKHTDAIEEGIADLNKLISEYPESPYADNAFVEIMEGRYRQKDRQGMEGAFQALSQKYPDSPLKARALFLLGEYCIKVERNRQDAIAFYTECFEKYPEGNTCNPALIRAADLVPSGNIDVSIAHYREALSNGKALSANLATWAELELGFALWLKGDRESAAVQFEKVSTGNNITQKYRDRAARYLEAIRNPDSMAAWEASFDLAFRSCEYMSQLDLGNNHYRNILRLAKTGIIEDRVKDTGVPEETRAHNLYQLAIAHYYVADFVSSGKIARRIIEEFPHSGEPAAHAEYLLAFLDAYSGRYEQAVERYLGILERYPSLSFDKSIMREIAQCQIRMGKYEEALVTLDGLAYLYPWRKEAGEAINGIEFLILGRQDLKDRLFSFSLRNGRNTLPSSIAENNDNNGFMARYYQAMKQMQIARATRPEIETHMDDILVSMK